MESDIDMVEHVVGKSMCLNVDSVGLVVAKL